jgi:hypothetical protein
LTSLFRRHFKEFKILVLKRVLPEETFESLKFGNFNRFPSKEVGAPDKSGLKLARGECPDAPVLDLTPATVES